MMKTQMEAQAANEQQKRDAEHQLQEARAETELKLQAMSRQASTAASGFTLTPSYFQNLLVQPMRQAMSYMPAT